MNAMNSLPAWASAADIGHALDLPALAVNKALEDAGLLDAETKQPTGRARSEGWTAAASRSSEEGRAEPAWSVQKVRELLQHSDTPHSKAEIAFEAFVREILRLEGEARDTREDGARMRYVNEELPRHRGTQAEVVAAVCERLGIAARTDEFVALVAPAETGRTASTLSGDPAEARDA